MTSILASRIRSRSAHFAAVVMLCSALPAAAQTASADTYPSRPVRVILPNSPGSLVDIVARLISDGLG